MAASGRPPHDPSDWLLGDARRRPDGSCWFEPDSAELRSGWTRVDHFLTWWDVDPGWRGCYICARCRRDRCPWQPYYELSSFRAGGRQQRVCTAAVCEDCFLKGPRWQRFFSEQKVKLV